jgi:hypothetical protein
MNTNDKDTPRCGICNVSNVKLYRPYGNFYRPEDNRCNEHVTEQERSYYIPCIVDTDGLTWGFTSVPQVECNNFYALPEKSKNGWGWHEKERWIPLDNIPPVC